MTRRFLCGSTGEVTGRARRLCASLAVGVLLMGGGTSLQAQTGPPYQIAFVSPYDRTRQIFLVNPVGGDLRRLTGPPGDSEGPAWSPDGQHLLFVRSSGDDTQIYTIGADGTDLRQLTTSPGTHAEATWSPDGRRIAYIARVAGGGRVSLMAADGSNPRTLTGPAGSASAPAWSPGGRFLAFLVQSEGSAADLYVARLETGDFRRISTPATGVVPGVAEFVWLQDGQHIAYTTRAGPAQSDISIVSLDGGTHRWLAFGHTPSWSPDGKRVAFVVAHVGGGQIYTKDLVADQAVALTDARYISMRPVWSPDGMWIAFLSIRGTDLALWVMHADGSAQRQLAPAAGNLSVLPVISWAPHR